MERAEHGVKAEIDFEVVVSEEESTVYVKFSGFEDSEDATSYAQYLADNLSLILFESEVYH
jgi:hypothetical protein